MQITMLGKRWTLRFAPNLGNGGDCDPPDHPRKEIRINSTLDERRELEVILHELTHAAFWHLDETYVENFANAAADVLRRLGYRKRN